MNLSLIHLKLKAVIVPQRYRPNTQVRYLKQVLTGLSTLPSVTVMLQDTAQYAQQRLTAGAPARHLHKMGDLQWTYHENLTNAENLTKLRPVIEKLYRHVTCTRKSNLMTYKTRHYNLVSDTTFEEHV